MGVPTGTKVTAAVHERADGAPGYVVVVRVGDGAGARIVRFPFDRRAEADALAASIVKYAEVGLPLDALFGGAAREG